MGGGLRVSRGFFREITFTKDAKPVAYWNPIFKSGFVIVKGKKRHYNTRKGWAKSVKINYGRRR